MNIPTFFQKFRRSIELGTDILRDRSAAVYAHPMNGVKVRADFVKDINPSAVDVAICVRLLQAYSKADKDRTLYSVAQNEDIWTAIARRQRVFFEILRSNDAGRLAVYLCNMSRHDATHGTVQGEIEYRHLKRSVFYRAYIARMAKDKLISLAEGVGAIECENPEQGSWGRTRHISEIDLAQKIEATIGISIIPPAIDGGLFKIGSDPYRFGERDCNAIYTAWLLRGLLPKAKSNAVCEIGGGVGRVAYWATRLGVESYTLLDLPHINVLQGFFLLKALPDANILLYGENVDQATTTAASLQIMPDYTCRDGQHRSFDLVLNQDSFPEIDADIVANYLEWIKTSAVSFLSINHESRPNLGNGAAQNNISQIVKQVGGFSREFRHLYWLRKGYVTELYRVKMADSKVI